MQDLGWREHRRQYRSWGFLNNFSVEHFSAAKPGDALSGTEGAPLQQGCERMATEGERNQHNQERYFLRKNTSSEKAFAQGSESSVFIK